MVRRIVEKIFLVTLALAVSLRPAKASAATCSFVSLSGLVFGSYEVFDAAPVDTSGSLTVFCTGVGTNDMIVIELGSGGASSAANRRLSAASGAHLYYNLYRDASHSMIWGDGQSGTFAYGPVNPPNGSNLAVTIYGLIPALQNASVGSYSDTVVATIQF